MAGLGSGRQTVTARLQNDPQGPSPPGIPVLLKSLPTPNSADLCHPEETEERQGSTSEAGSQTLQVPPCVHSGHLL